MRTNLASNSNNFSYFKHFYLFTWETETQRVLLSSGPLLIWLDWSQDPGTQTPFSHKNDKYQPSKPWPVASRICIALAGTHLQNHIWSSNLGTQWEWASWSVSLPINLTSSPILIFWNVIWAGAFHPMMLPPSSMVETTQKMKIWTCLSQKGNYWYCH